MYNGKYLDFLLQDSGNERYSMKFLRNGMVANIDLGIEKISAVFEDNLRREAEKHKKKMI